MFHLHQNTHSDETSSHSYNVVTTLISSVFWHVIILVKLSWRRTSVVFQVRGTITTSSSFCSPSCWWEPGCSTAASCVSDRTCGVMTASDTALHLHWEHTPALCVCFQTGRPAAWCIMRSRACGAWSPPWSAALPGCSASSCWPSITPAGPAWSCCCSSTRWPAASVSLFLQLS